MNDDRGLEDRLRRHYADKADELRLPGLEWDQLKGQHRGRGRPVSTWLVAASVLALVAGSAIGAAVVLGNRSERSAATVPSTAAPVPGSSPWSVMSGCEHAEPVPTDFEAADVSNDFRSPGLLLPVGLDGYCVVDHTFVNHSSQVVGPNYTVWTDCGECENPTVSVAFSSAPIPEVWLAELGDGTPVDVGGRDGTFYDAAPTPGPFRLYSTGESGEPVVLTGWGLDQEAARAALQELLDSARGNPGSSLPQVNGDPAAHVTSLVGLEQVYFGGLGQFDPGKVPFVPTFGVSYWADGGDELLTYQVQREAAPVPLQAYSFAAPGSRLTTLNGRSAVAFGTSAGTAGLNRTAVIVQLDENTRVLWTHQARSPMSPEDLASIELTEADLDDPRWAEIAWESGMYDAVG